MQNGMLAAQAEYAGRPKLLAQASGCAIAAQFLGGVIGLAVGEAVFSSELRSNLATFAPTAPYELIARSPLNIWTQLDPTLITQVVLAYVKSLDLVYVVCVPAGPSSPPPLVCSRTSTDGMDGLQRGSAASPRC